MALKIKWTPLAEKGLEGVLEYLENEWTIKEILKLEDKINRVISQIILNPELFPKSSIHKNLHKAIIDKNNYLVYSVNNKKGIIEIINFRGAKQEARH